MAIANEATGSGDSADTRIPWTLFQSAIGMAFIGIVAYCFRFSSAREAIAVGSTAILVAGAAFAAGGFVGFLFGIPGAPKGTDDRPSRNTSLIQISDWLTKLLVGAGLTQLGRLPGEATKLTDHLSEGLGNDDVSSVFALAIIVYLALVGFLLTYLWTSINLYQLLSDEAAGIKQRVEEVSKRTEEARKEFSEVVAKAANDPLALKLIENQLSPSKDVPSPSIDELRAAIGEASDGVRAQIFVRAQNARSESWRSDKAKMQLAIPIFEALIDTGSDKDHAVHGQLGFALKDQTRPDWSAAERELSRAIELRGPQQVWLFYEFNRAICRIRQDPAFASRQPSPPDVRDRILEDVRTITQADFLIEIIDKGEGGIKEWMSLNGVSVASLRT